MAVGGGLIIPWLIFSLLPNKDVRYFIPALPFAILLAANVLGQIKFQKPLIVFVVLLGLFYQINLMIGSPEDKRILIPVRKPDLNIALYRRNYYTTTAPSTKTWQAAKIVQTIKNRASRDHEPKVVFTGLQLTPFNFYTILYYSQIEVPGFDLSDLSNDWRGKEFAILRYYPDDTNMPTLITKSTVEEFLATTPMDHPVKLLATFDQPDGGKINVYDLRGKDVSLGNYSGLQ